VFAYASGGDICTESYFSRTDRVIGGTIIMKSADGTEIERATTKVDGSYCFPNPTQTGDLTFEVLAGEGHRGDFTLYEADRPVLAPIPSDTQTDNSANTGTSPASGTVPGAVSGTTDQQIRQIVRDELTAQISPLVRKISEITDDKTPGIREIVGGLGWIVGIGGLIFWVRRRKEPLPKPTTSSR
jgi:nickel transport protein